MIQVKCETCGQALSIPEQYAGQKGRCNKCGGEVMVPALPSDPSQAQLDPLFDVMDQNPPAKKRYTPAAKDRHGCLTAWLVLMIITNSLMVLAYLLASGIIKQTMPNAPAWAFPVLIVGGIANVVFAVALFRWKKWGFFGFIAMSAVGFAVNLASGLNILQALFGLVGIPILYGVLQIGKERLGPTGLIA